MASLAEELPKEQARVRELQQEYRDLPGGVGQFGAALMEQSLREAETASASGDVVAMLAAYEKLKSHTG